MNAEKADEMKIMEKEVCRCEERAAKHSPAVGDITAPFRLAMNFIIFTSMVILMNLRLSAFICVRKGLYV